MPSPHKTGTTAMATIEPEKPELPIHHLARYMVATPLQRRRLLERQKQPFLFADTWYEFADNSISRFITEGCQHPEILVNTIDDLHREVPESPSDEVRLQNNAAALEAFHDHCEALDFTGLTVTEGPREDPPKLDVAGVMIHVRPEFLLAGESRGRPIVGALKLYFSKDQPLDDVTGPYLTAVVSEYVHKHVAQPGQETWPRLCQVYDLFAHRLHRAPRGTARRMQEVEAACQEIALLWPHV